MGEEKVEMNPKSNTYLERELMELRKVKDFSQSTAFPSPLHVRTGIRKCKKDPIKVK
jgi:hypothetical protein